MSHLYDTDIITYSFGASSNCNEEALKESLLQHPSNLLEKSSYANATSLPPLIFIGLLYNKFWESKSANAFGLLSNCADITNQVWLAKQCRKSRPDASVVFCWHRFFFHKMVFQKIVSWWQNGAWRANQGSPKVIDPTTAAELEDSSAISEERLKELLAEVDLEYLVEREGGVEAVVDWGAQLSLGEQQRLGMARLFYHTPKFAILDECTSGVTVRHPPLHDHALDFLTSRCSAPWCLRKDLSEHDPPFLLTNKVSRDRMCEAQLTCCCSLLVRTLCMGQCQVRTPCQRNHLISNHPSQILMMINVTWYPFLCEAFWKAKAEHARML